MKLKKLLSYESTDFLIVTVCTVLCSLVHFAYSIYARKYIEPTEYGIYTTCVLLQTYMNYLRLGTVNAYNRDYPQLIGAGKYEEAERLRNTVFTYLLAVFAVGFVLTAIVVTLITVSGVITAFYAVGYIASALISAVTVFEAFASSTVKMNGKFTYYGVTYLLRTVISVIIGLFLIKTIGYYSLYIVAFIAVALGFVFYIKDGFRHFRLEMHFDILKVCIYTGLPLMINALIWSVVTSIDKFVILYFMDNTRLGFYSIATMGFSTMVLIPTSVSQVFYIKINKAYGRHHSVKKLISDAARSTRITTACTCVAAVVAYYMIPLIVKVFMPKYTEGVAAAQIIILGVSVYASTMLYGNVFTIMRKNFLLLRNTVYLCIFNAVFSVAFVLIFGVDVKNVAVGTAVSYALYSLLLMIRLKTCFNVKLWDVFAASWVPVIVTLVPILVIDRLPINVYLKFIIGFVAVCSLIVITNLRELVALLNKKKSPANTNDTDHN